MQFIETDHEFAVDWLGKELADFLVPVKNQARWGMYEARMEAKII